MKITENELSADIEIRIDDLLDKIDDVGLNEIKLNFRECLCELQNREKQVNYWEREAKRMAAELGEIKIKNGLLRSMREAIKR